jgi:predicted SAM-dependent methyltransferase
MNKLKNFIKKIPIIRTFAISIYNISARIRDGIIIKKTDSQLRCYVCGNRVGKFKPLSAEFQTKFVKYGYIYYTNKPEACNRNNYSCPYCGSTDRCRLQVIFIDKSCVNKKEIAILGIAPSKQISNFIKKRFSNATYITMDLFRNDVDYKVDITNMHAFESEKFDFFMCSHVLEHVIDDKKAMSELYRILKRGGQGLLLVPLVVGVDETDEDITATLEERWRRFGQDDHVRQYGKADFIRRLVDTGFYVKEIGISNFKKELFEQNCIEKQSTLYIVTK